MTPARPLLKNESLVPRPRKQLAGLRTPDVSHCAMRFPSALRYDVPRHRRWKPPSKLRGPAMAECEARRRSHGRGRPEGGCCDLERGQTFSIFTRGPGKGMGAGVHTVCHQSSGAVLCSELSRKAPATGHWHVGFSLPGGGGGSIEPPKTGEGWVWEKGSIDKDH